MDPSQFDHMIRTLSAAGSRRGLLVRLGAVPVLGGLLAVLDPLDAEGKGRRKRRKKRHKHGKGRRRTNRRGKPKCRAESLAQTCGGKCGAVTNNCGKAVDCGSCDCSPACGECFTCQSGPNTHGTCVPDPAQQGEACGSDGQVCGADGVCACDGASCGDCRTCEPDGTCAGCADCCDGATCVAGDSTSACGHDGGQCTACDGTTPICTEDGCAACSVTQPCPDGQCCAGDGSCVPTCPSCQTCDAGLCVANAAQQGLVCAGSGATTSICCSGVCCDGCCDADGECGACLAFATSTIHTGNLGGLSGADAACQTRADAADLPGTYKAWLSIGNGANESPATGRFRQSGQPYQRVDGEDIASDWADLTSGSLNAPLNVSESGGTPGFYLAWTATRADGTVEVTPETFDCADWTTTADSGSSGDTNLTNSAWASGGGMDACGFDFSLYCFQQE